MTHTLSRIYTVEVTAEQFNPETHPWPTGVLQNNYDGKLLANSYFLVMDYRIMPIHPGDWITYDPDGRPTGTLDYTTVENQWAAQPKRYTKARA